MTEFAKGGIIPPDSEPPLRPAPTDTSWLAFEPAPRSLWPRIRSLLHRDGITKRESEAADGDQS